MKYDIPANTYKWNIKFLKPAWQSDSSKNCKKQQQQKMVIQICFPLVFLLSSALGEEANWGYGEEAKCGCQCHWFGFMDGKKGNCAR